MDILDRYLGYEAWTLRHFIVRCGELTPGDWQRTFDVGQGTVQSTLEHIIGNLEVWTDLMRERSVRDVPSSDGVEAYLQRFDAAVSDFTELSREQAAEGRLDATYVDVLDDPPTHK